MRNSTLIDLAAGACAIAAAVVVLLVFWQPPPALDRVLHAAIGRALAKESFSLLSPGGQITVITRDTETFPQPALDVLLRTFKREAHRAHVVIGGVHLLQTDPLRPIDVPPGDFYELIRRAAPGNVIVSFQGPPLLSPEQRNALGPIKPKIVAFCPGNLGESVDVRQLFSAGLLHAAIVGCRPVDAASTPATQARRDFDQLYKVLRATDSAPPTAPGRPQTRSANESN